jgi:hypothetical protein
LALLSTRQLNEGSKGATLWRRTYFSTASASRHVLPSVGGYASENGAGASSLLQQAIDRLRNNFLKIGRQLKFPALGKSSARV